MSLHVQNISSFSKMWNTGEGACVVHYTERPTLGFGSCNDFMGHGIELCVGLPLSRESA